MFTKDVYGREYLDISILLLGLFGSDPNNGMLLHLGFYELQITFFKEEGRIHLTIYCVSYEKPDNAKCIGRGGYEDYRFRMYSLTASSFVSRMDWHVGAGKTRKVYLKNM